MNDPAPPSRLPSILLVGLLCLLGLGLSWYFRPMPDNASVESLSSTAAYEVRDEALGIAYLPRRDPAAEAGAAPAPGRALVFYPGARVPPEAYAWIGVGLAAAGHPVYLVRFPFNFAIFAPGRAAEVERLHPEFAGAYLGGHSLGGAMAASYAGSHPGSTAGLLLLAAWAPESARLGSASLPVLLLSGSEDGLATEAKIAKALPYLPGGTRRVVIQGGNHAQFGEYGPQPGDGQARIEGERQRALALEAMLAFLEDGARQ